MNVLRVEDVVQGGNGEMPETYRERESGKRTLGAPPTFSRRFRAESRSDSAAFAFFFSASPCESSSVILVIGCTTVLCMVRW